MCLYVSGNLGVQNVIEQGNLRVVECDASKGKSVFTSFSVLRCFVCLLVCVSAGLRF